MSDVTRIHKQLESVSQQLESAVDTLLHSTTLRKAKAEAEFEGTKGAWRRVGGMNLFLREGDGVIMNGPLALRGQPMSNITSDDFKAIPKVKALYSKKGKKAIPGEDIQEVASGVSTTNMTADNAMAVVTKGFNSVKVTIKRKQSPGRYEVAEEKDFTGGAEIDLFEQAKAWARQQLRGRYKKG